MLMELVAESEHLTSMDVVEVNSMLDMQNVTAQLGVELVLLSL